MKKIIISGIIITILFIVLFNCTQESNPVDSNTPIVDPITQIWTNQADSNYTVFFQTYDSTVARGIFNGIEYNPDINIGESDLCGFFDKFYLEFDVYRNTGRIKFKGKFINSNRMELQSSEGSLVLTR
jgi:hypothetical protein